MTNKFPCLQDIKGFLILILTSFKTAVDKPLLKKLHIDPGSLNDYSPSSVYYGYLQLN